MTDDGLPEIKVSKNKETITLKINEFQILQCFNDVIERFTSYEIW